jgi:hypothetical protein
VEVDVEVVDAPLDYNILLGCNWTYSMTVVVSSIFSYFMFSSGRENHDDSSVILCACQSQCINWTFDPYDQQFLAKN